MVKFCERWFRQKKKMINPFDEQIAKKRDLKGVPYTVVLGKQESPFCFIERNSRSYAVNFLDSGLRIYLIYSFEEIYAGRLFLQEAIFFEFENSKDDSLSKSTVYWFSPNGKVVIENVEYPSEKARRTETTANVSRNWDEKPIFGQYENLIKIERLQPIS